MKKRHSIQILLAAAALLLATAACTKNELADGDRLPEGQYPLEIARITLSVEGGEAQPWGTPATRVSENGDGTGSVWEWDGSEMIGVQLGDKTTTYTLNTDHTLLADRQLYWTSTAPNQPVTAWYPATDGTLDLRDQDTNGLAYLLHGTGTGDYLTPVTLTFTHSLAKVRVTPSDAIGDDEVTSLQLFTYRTCTYNQGKVVQGKNEGWIEMKPCEYNDVTCWEANVVPGKEITKLRANGTEERTLSAAINPEAGSFYNITLNNDKGYTDDGNGNYTVTTAEGLKAVADIANNGNRGINITLTENINLTDMDWTPIGIDYNHQYTGTFNGGGHTITGLTVTGSDQYAGLFGYIGKDGGTVKNVVLENVQITSDYQYGYVGGVAGKTDNSATLTACYATGNVTFERASTINTFAGGVVGSNGTGSILTACYATGNVTGTGTGTGSCYVGGVTGDNASGTLTACYHATGTVSGPDGATGGVTGRNYTSLGAPVITACYWGDNGQEQGIGYNQAGTIGGTEQVTDGNWQNAVTQMNAALSGKGWQYELKDGTSLPALKKEQ